MEKKFLKIALKKQMLKLFIPIEKKDLQEMFLCHIAIIFSKSYR